MTLPEIDRILAALCTHECTCREAHPKAHSLINELQALRAEREAVIEQRLQTAHEGGPSGQKLSSRSPRWIWRPSRLPCPVCGRPTQEALRPRASWWSGSTRRAARFSGTGRTIRQYSASLSRQGTCLEWTRGRASRCLMDIG